MISEKTELRLYSLGIVVETKPPGTDWVVVSPLEVINIQNSKLIKDNKRTFEGTLPQPDGKNFKTEIKASDYLRAKWIPFAHSNRMTAPDVVKNETIILFKYGDVDEYYWTTIFREPEIRRLETVLYAYCDIPKGLVAFDKTTSYWTEVDTRNKTVKLHTSDNDGEFTEYDVIIETKVGRLTIKDKRNNSIILTSFNDTWTITANTLVKVVAPNIILDGDVHITGNLTVAKCCSCAC